MVLSKEQAQQLLQKVHKLATPFSDKAGPAADTIGKERSGTVVNPMSQNNQRAFIGKYNDPEIKKMQQALIGLAQDVTAELNIPQNKHTTKYAPNMEVTVKEPRDPETQQAAGRDSFGDFFLKHFLRTSDIPGIEFTPDPTKTDVPEKDPRTPSKLSWFMDTVQRVGGPKAEKLADGDWGPRTNEAVIDAYALAYGLLKMAHDFGIQVTSYNDKDLAGLKGATELKPEVLADIAEKKEMAPTVTNHIQAIRRLYNEIKRNILEIPKYKAFIEGDKPYLHHEKNVKKDLTPVQIASMKQTFPQGFNIVVDGKIGSLNLPVDALTNLNTLNEWIGKFTGIKLTPDSVLSQVSQQVASQAKGN